MNSKKDIFLKKNSRLDVSYENILYQRQGKTFKCVGGNNRYLLPS